MNSFELWLRRLGGVAGLVTLALAIWRMLASVHRPAGLAAAWALHPQERTRHPGQ